jgi:imidazolonepropionase-like amidohydrolase
VKRRLVPTLLGGVLALATLLPLSVTPLRGQAQTPGVIAIRNATLMTASRGVIQNGTIVIRDGKIAAVGGANTAIPAGAQVIEGKGKWVSPGIIDAHSHIANDAINEGATAVSSMTDMGDVLNPRDIAIQRDVAGGVTTANILHGSANPIGGKTVVIKLRWGVEKGKELLFEGALPGIKFALGENPKRPAAQINAQGPLRYPTTRQGVEYVIRDAFTRAKAYQKAWQEFDKAKAGVPPRRDLQLDALVEIMEGKRLVHAHCYRADEILMMIRLADEMGFKVATFQHVLEGYKVAKEIAAHGAGASTFSDWWGYKIEAEDAIPGNASVMTAKGVSVSINSDSAEHARRLNTEAAKSIRWGDMNDEQAMALVTLNPAKQLRIDQRVGSLDVGKDADIVIWNAHPLSTMATVDKTFIDGKVYYDRDIEWARTELIAKERAGRGGQGAAPAAAATPGNLFNIPSEPLEIKLNTSGGTWAITNARIHPISGPVIEKGTVVIRGNRIQAVGATVSIPAGARVVDARGANVVPGFIDAATDMGLNEPGVRNYDDVSEMLDFNQMLRTRVAYQADSDSIPVARVEGITSAGIFMTGGVISGDVPLMNLDGWTWEETQVRPVAGLQLNFPGGGGGGGRGGGGGGRGAGPGGGGAGLPELDKLLAQARAYGSNANRTMDWNLEALVPIVQKKVPFFVSAGSEQAVGAAISWAERQGVNIVIRTSPATAVATAELLKAKNVPVILSTILAMPQGEDTFHAATYQAPGLLSKAGVTFAFSSGGFETVRLVPFQAAMAVAWGLDRNEALKALTINAAKIFGADRAVGTLEAGKIANLIVVNGDPLEIKSRVMHVIIGGRDVPLESKHTELFKRYMGRQ